MTRSGVEGPASPQRTPWLPDQEFHEESVVEDPLRGIVEVVELTRAGGEHEQPGEHGAEGDGDRQQDEDDVHREPSRAARRDSTRSPPHNTNNEDNGINTAATSGLTKPNEANATAVRL